jgi:hypothetical protein
MCPAYETVSASTAGADRVETHLAAIVDVALVLVVGMQRRATAVDHVQPIFPRRGLAADNARSFGVIVGIARDVFVAPRDVSGTDGHGLASLVASVLEKYCKRQWRVKH